VVLLTLIISYNCKGLQSSACRSYLRFLFLGVTEIGIVISNFGTLLPRNV